MAALTNKQAEGGPSDSGAFNAKRIAMGLAAVAAIGLLLWGLSRIQFDAPSAPKRQVVKITLPDTPPPPPPKPEEKKPEPKEEDKPMQQMEQKPIEAPPQQEQSLKMEGAAGDGPSAFSSGSVSKDYQDGAVTTGNGGTNSDRAKYQFYVSSIKQLLKDALERNLQTDEKRVTVTFALWIGADGHIQKFELSPVGDEHTQADVQAAFERATRDTSFPPPGDTPQPMRMRMTLLPPAS